MSKWSVQPQVGAFLVSSTVLLVTVVECLVSVSEMEVEHEDTAASTSATETEDYPATADEADETKNDQLSSRVRLPGGT